MTPELSNDALIAFLVQYVGLGTLFFLGLFVAWRQGDVGTRTRRQRQWLAILVGGYLAYAAAHGLFQFVLVRI